jgi:molybdate transport system regulatory protein
MQHPVRLNIEIICGDEVAMGPSTADLLDAIAEHHSISAAARAMGMSYRFAWQMVDRMNRCWQEAVVATTPGSQKVGAHLTPFGEMILAQYRAVQSEVEQIGSERLAVLVDQSLLLAPRQPRRK